MTGIYGSVSKPCTPVVHIKISGKWMLIPLKMVLIGIDPYPYLHRLVVLTILKNMKVNGKDYPIYYGKMWKIKND